jgi:hypothetical protein
MGYDGGYVWVVVCKNRRFHVRQNLWFGHKIPLGETDAFLPPPNVEGCLHVRCDECGQEYAYKPKDLLRTELDLPERFTPHPMFL